MSDFLSKHFIACHCLNNFWDGIGASNRGACFSYMYWLENKIDGKFTNFNFQFLLKANILYVPLIMQQLAAWAGVGLVNWDLDLLQYQRDI
jgi:hypothetical protein